MLFPRLLSHGPKEPFLLARLHSTTPSRVSPHFPLGLTLTKRKPIEEVHLRPLPLSVLLFSRALEMGASAHSGLKWPLRLMGNMMNLVEPVSLKLSCHWKQGEDESSDGYNLVTLFDLEGVAFILSLSPTPSLNWNQESLSISVGSQGHTTQGSLP